MSHTVEMTEEQYTTLQCALGGAIEELNDKIYEREDDYEPDDIARMEDEVREYKEAGDWLKIATGHALRWHDHFTTVKDEDGEDTGIPYPAGQEVPVEELHHVWTVLDCDGELCIAPGFHWVNRVSHIKTVQAWTEHDENQEWIY